VNDRALITLGILVLVAMAMGCIVILAPAMKRIFWIAGLSLVLFEFGAITVGIAWRGIGHRHLSGKGFFMLIANALISWLIVEYLSKKIREPKLHHSSEETTSTHR
jgi:hypothetical protein